MKIWTKLKELFAIRGDDPELVQEQFRVFVKQLPLMYFILGVNALAIVYTVAPLGRGLMTAYIPGALIAVCVVRGVTWWRRADQAIATDDALAMMRSTVKLSAVNAIGFSLWGDFLFFQVDADAKANIVFFLALTMIGCVSCLTQLRPAALIVAVIGVGPFCLYYGCVDGGRFAPTALNLALVTGGMVATLLRNYRDFAHLVASQRELTVKQRETQRLSDENSQLANIDPLTGLANRRAFILRLTELSGTPGAGVGEVAMAFVDLDGFKTVNDDFGHEVGDALIAHVARELARRLPARALLARLGGDEFAAVNAGSDAQLEMLAFAAHVRNGFSRPVSVGARTVQVGASIGVAAAACGECDGQELLRRADVAMYNVKANGKFGFRLYTPELDAERRQQLALREEIRAGLERHEFEVFYQPIVDAQTKAITSVEALLRWPRRPAGPIGPDEFIPVAEAEGLIEPLGLFALRRACEDFRGFAPINLSVNVSPAQFHDPDFESKVAEILSQTGFAAGRLSLEVTEGYLIDNPERAATVIAALKTMGISVVLDDFGTGYTSIAYLQKYGFSAIKIDRSLASRIGDDSKARVLVTGVVYLANGLNMPVTAEGVETEAQAQLLRLAGCQNLQGYRYYRPKPMSELLADELAPGRAAVA